MKECKALRDLTLLYQENNTVDLIDQIDLDALLQEADKSISNPTLMFKKASTTFPSSSINPNVAVFLKQTIHDICKLSQSKFKPRNLSYDENQVLHHLTKNSKIVIKPSDRGGNVVVMNNDDYTSMCLNILENREWYRQISALNINQCNSTFYTMVDRTFHTCAISKNIY